ncbi:Na+/H+ antiporter subunit E [Pelagibacterium halotolerans]|uniref:Na(+) H(+) antiporter subunit E n=1 Tax=Pelagibacterium halotolerans (strain DSM 22347 / JCM 15775 / CGMCC 1.7692 / B2) TaxID=1082931 RepID=G4RCJ0_PELHB|nr:Na+/H+ antiporter subunit E [Pelagibacterium halotolerans]AEQ50662.1 Na(+) H(+) antiporter subunit E [Pelagibacterium halotolerans B2]QJR19404.1 Na+/H+ antiporter subunit E [Pelagibacterium halotolerans]SDZ92373.1 multicomponent Na+:H+ antiporter subunit E [Pelagibacterium halotolerans]
MSFAFLVITLALVWAAVTGTFTLLNLLLGAFIGALAALFIRDRVDRPYMMRRLVRALSLAALFFYELALSAWRVAILVISPRMERRLSPGIIAYPLTVTSDIQITLLANLITLTPGTLSVEVSEDRAKLYIHVLEMNDRDEVIASIRNGFEARIIEVFQ